MCGLAGIWNRVAGRPVDVDALERMGDALAHRGPDDRGIYLDTDAALGLAHRRLSILDLARGHQPMSTPEGDLHISFNGEIYNYRELNDELAGRGHAIRTSSDTETILHLYREHGPACVEHLNGAFAFALWDSRQRQLLLARDRLGIKPLYFAQTGDGLLFASEVRAFLSVGFPLALNPRGLQDYLSLGYILSPHSILRGVNKLEPGHRIVVTSSGFTNESYWDLAASFREGHEARKTGDPQPSSDEIDEDILSQLDRAVERRLISDVPVGSFLSGGIDSSAVTAQMVRRRPSDVSTFSIGFEDPRFDERGEARFVADLLGTRHHERILRPDVESLIPEVAWASDEPIADSSILPTYLLSGFARESITVALAGDGGDENFAGYEAYFADALFSAFHHIPRWGRRTVGALASPFTTTGPLRKLRRFLAASGRHRSEAEVHYSWRTFFDDGALAQVLEPDVLDPDYHSFQRVSEHYAQVADLPALSRHLYSDIKTWLVDDILTKVDRASMAHSLEVRVPFLDHELVEYAARLAPGDKLRGREKKFVLRRALQRQLPDRVLHRPKAGFGAPVGRWLGQELAEWTRDTLSPERVAALGVLRPTVVEQLVDAHVRGVRDHSLQLFSLVMLVLWHERARELCQTSGLVLSGH